MMPDVGQRLDDDRFELVERIAIGGMGEVWMARDYATGQPVAIKILRHEYTGDQTFLARLRLEARNATPLIHPNIAAIIDYFEADGTGFLVMEYVDGRSLADLLAEEHRLEPRRLIPMLIQCARALYCAHSTGVIHRDIKPGNILLARGDLVKLTDFGISVADGQETLTDTGKVMGTVHYLAPEQALGRPATPAGDMYALGVVAYEALAGHRPFTGPSHIDIALAQVHSPVPPLPKSTDPQLAALVMRLLAKDPRERPADCGELAELLASANLRWILDQDRAARPSGRQRRDAPFAHRPQRPARSPLDSSVGRRPASPATSTRTGTGTGTGTGPSRSLNTAGQPDGATSPVRTRRPVRRPSLRRLGPVAALVGAVLGLVVWFIVAALGGDPTGAAFGNNSDTVTGSMRDLTGNRGIITSGHVGPFALSDAPQWQERDR